jgi:hypothetical protein
MVKANPALFTHCADYHPFSGLERMLSDSQTAPPPGAWCLRP